MRQYRQLRNVFRSCIGNMKFKDYVKEGFVLLDGGTGSNLQLHGMQAGDCPETWILDHPDVFVELQKGYIEAGSDVLYAPTFTCSSIKLAEYGLEGRQKELITDLVQLTKRAVEESRTERNIYIAGDMTMTGEQLEPVGSLPFEELIDVYKEQAAYLYDVCRRNDDEPAGVPWRRAGHTGAVWGRHTGYCDADVSGRWKDALWYKP